MVTRIASSLCIGINACLIEIEVDISSGLPHIAIVGLPDQAVKESKDRIKAAIKNSGFSFPSRRKVLINLAPADIKKEGPLFDLPIAIAILTAQGSIDPRAVESFCIVGELALNGTVRAINGALPIALGLAAHNKKMISPAQNAREAALQQAVAVYPVNTLEETVAFLNGEKTIDRQAVSVSSQESTVGKYSCDFSDVRGQRLAKRALEIAVSGGHNLLMIGPPGSGKTMLAKRIPTILPDLSYEETLEITQIYSVGGAIAPASPFVPLRPFRFPHHTISSVALIGGGSDPKPGEVSFAHNGVLFLDELPEFPRNVLEMLRGPLEDKKITVARVKHVTTFPSNFMLVCAMNPCPCGFYGDRKKECRCSQTKIERYRSRISGPLFDRIDMHVEVRRLPLKELQAPPACEEPSDVIRKRVNAARQTQRLRFKKNKNIYMNAQMGTREIREHCVLTRSAQQLLEHAVKELIFSARTYHKILKVARTIRDMKLMSLPGQRSDATIESEDIAEALQYRALDAELLP